MMNCLSYLILVLAVDKVPSFQKVVAKRKKEFPFHPKPAKDEDDLEIAV